MNNVVSNLLGRFLYRVLFVVLLVLVFDDFSIEKLFFWQLWAGLAFLSACDACYLYSSRREG